LAGAGLLSGCPPTKVAKAPSAPAAPEGTAPGTAPAPVPGGVPVAHLTHSGVWTSAGQLSTEVVLEMLDKGLVEVTGRDSADAAWQSLFASDDVVGIKVNQISGSVYTNPVVALAIAGRLMDLSVPAGNIIIWDRNNGELQRNGYAPGGAPTVRGVDGDWEDRATRQGSFNGRLAKILTQQCSALINVPVLKDHGGAGVTLAMKNHYGSHDNPGSHHGNQCDPYIADLNSIGAIKDKTRLIVCDATKGCFRGGPGADDPSGCWLPNSILVATDPVAHDTYGTQLINAKRAEMGLGAVQPRQLASAAERNLGTNDPAGISVLATQLA
jgi:hypothetical protein